MGEMPSHIKKLEDFKKSIILDEETKKELDFLISGITNLFVVKTNIWSQQNLLKSSLETEVLKNDCYQDFPFLKDINFFFNLSTNLITYGQMELDLLSTSLTNLIQKLKRMDMDYEAIELKKIEEQQEQQLFRQDVAGIPDDLSKAKPTIDPDDEDLKKLMELKDKVENIEDEEEEEAYLPKYYYICSKCKNVSEQSISGIGCAFCGNETLEIKYRGF